MKTSLFFHPIEFNCYFNFGCCCKGCSVLACCLRKDSVNFLASFVLLRMGFIPLVPVLKPATQSDVLVNRLFKRMMNAIKVFFLGWAMVVLFCRLLLLFLFLTNHSAFSPVDSS